MLPLDAKTIALITHGAKPVSLSNVVKFKSQLVGLDKSLRFVQYESKHLAALTSGEMSGQLTLLSKGMGTHRRAWRLGKWLDELHKFQLALRKTTMDPLTRALTLLARFAMGMYLANDNVVWFCDVKMLKKWDRKAWKLRADRFRWAACIANLALVLLKLVAGKRKVAKLEDGGAGGGAIAKARESNANALVELARHSCDFVTYANGSKVGLGSSDAVVGLLGACSSLFAGYKVWKDKV